MEFDVEAVHPDNWTSLGEFLRRSGYATEALRALLDLADPADEIVKNTGRYSLFYLDQLQEADDAFASLARLFLLAGPVPAADLDSLGGPLTELLRRTNLIVPVENDATLVRGTVAITELAGRHFLSDALFENRGDEFVVYDEGIRCMPPHASSLELLGALRRPDGAVSFLDVGCGSGCQSLVFAADYQRVVGFDLSPRHVSFARANAHLNAVRATFVVDRWETFPPDRQFDHVVFNTPDAETAFSFINMGLEKLLTPSGHAQIWLIGELTAHDRSWEAYLARQLCQPGRWDVEPVLHAGSPFALAPENLEKRRMPNNTLLVRRPEEAARYLRGLDERRVTEVASMTLTIRHGPDVS